jgi:hypothetical protein
MAKLTKKLKEKMIADGYGAHVEILEINESGYAGILSNGNIVSRLQYPDAIPVPQNSLMGIPKPKRLKKDIHSELVCTECGIYFLTPEQLEAGGGAYTANMGTCGVCDKEDLLLPIRHYNYLIHYKYKPKRKKRNE